MNFLTVADPNPRSPLQEAQESTVYVSFKTERSANMTPNQYLRQLRGLVFESALSNRLFKLSRGADPPFASASVGSEPLTVSITSNTLSATAYTEGDDAALRALETLLIEVARIRMHGFTSKEIERAMKDLKVIGACMWFREGTSLFVL